MWAPGPICKRPETDGANLDFICKTRLEPPPAFFARRNVGGKFNYTIPPTASHDQLGAIVDPDRREFFACKNLEGGKVYKAPCLEKERQLFGELE